MKGKEIKINETLESLNGIRPAEISSSLNERIMNRLFNTEARIITIRPQAKWAIAASLALLVTLNSLIVLQYNKTVKENRTEAYSLYKNYFDYTEQF